MTIKTHAEFSPSQLHRIMRCPGSVRLSRVLEKETEEEKSVYAQEGTMLHEVVEHTLLDDRTTSQTPEAKARDLTLEQSALVDDVKEYVQALVFDIENPNVDQEVHVSLEAWDLPEVAGWVDAVVRDTQRKVVHVLDWKFGGGNQVFVHRNEQMMAYACGVISKHQIPPDWTVVLHVVQPRLEHYDSWATNPQELYTWMVEEVAPLVLSSLTEKPKFNPGTVQCKWCPVKDHCDHRIQWIRGTMAEAFTVAEGITEVKQKDIIDILSKIPALRKAVNEIEQYALNEILMGRPIAGYKAVYGRSIRKWVDEDMAESWLLDRFEEDQIFKRKLISPAQAEALDRGLKKDTEFELYWEKPQGRPKVVKDTDKREGIGPSKSAAEAFKDFE
jgi:hypothetical protein